MTLGASYTARASVTDQFIRLITYASGGAPARTVSADSNRDGKTDIVALNTNGVLSFLPGTGTGAFGAPKTIAHTAALLRRTVAEHGGFQWR